MKECRICGRNSVKNELCEYHYLAYNNLRIGFQKWSEAIGGLTWENFVERVYELENTGQWVKEVIDDIISRDDP